MKLIDVNALIKALGITDMNCERCAWYSGREWSLCKMGSDFEQACFVIEHTPEAVVRCRDCENWGRDEMRNGAAPCEQWSDIEDWRFKYTEGDDFCSYAERRTDE